MIQIRDIKLPINHKENEIRNKIIAVCHLKNPKYRNLSFDYKILRRSIDARKKPDIYYIYLVAVSFGKYEKDICAELKKHKVSNIVYEAPVRYSICDNSEGLCLKNRPVITGSGPAGLFAAYILAQKGYKPLVIERGEDVDRRSLRVNESFKSNDIDEESNVQFGEGGAGTFSDGKLNTLTKDLNGRNAYVLESFASFGAPADITVNAKPHIGTDILRDVVKNMRNRIIELGGEFLFDTKLTDIMIENGHLVSVRTTNTRSGSSDIIDTQVCILALGHSARDTFEMLYAKGLLMEAKSFAVGFRVQHPQSYVDKWQYGVENASDIGLQSADYKVATQTSLGRGVYSFCMCPGGYVVNASSEKGRMCVNGMSENKRDSGFADSAIIVGITPDDFIQDTVSVDNPLKGMYYQREIEKRAYARGKGSIPVQYFKDFEKNAGSDDIDPAKCSVKGNAVSANLRGILEDELDEAVIEAINDFGRTREGFNDENVLMYGIEARTSSPVRMPRNEGFESNIAGIYPCGEGAGYAGGITSAAADGIKTAEAVIRKYLPANE